MWALLGVTEAIDQVTIPTVVGAFGSTLLASSDSTVNCEPSTMGPPVVPVVSVVLAPSPVVEVVASVVAVVLSVAPVVAVEPLVPLEVGVDVVDEVVPLPDVEVLLVDVALLAALLTLPVLPVLLTLLLALSVSFEDSASGELLQATPLSSRTRPSRDSVLVIIASYHFLSYSLPSSACLRNSKRFGFGQACRWLATEKRAASMHKYACSRPYAPAAVISSNRFAAPPIGLSRRQVLESIRQQLGRLRCS